MSNQTEQPDPVAAFLAGGGKIYQAAHGETGHKKTAHEMFVDRTRKRNKANKGRKMYRQKKF